MRKILTGLLFLGYLLHPLAAMADGRYQAITLSDGGGIGPEKVMILDTEAGHMWVWTENPATPAAPGGRLLIYQGRLRPGNDMGEVILRQEWGKTPALAKPAPADKGKHK